MMGCFKTFASLCNQHHLEALRKRITLKRAQPVDNWLSPPAFVLMMRSYFSQQLGGRNSSCSHVSDSTLIFPILHSAGPAVTRQMFPTSPTLLLFVLRCSLVKHDNSVICILFHPPAPLSKCKIYIFARTKVNWFGSGFGEAICLQLSEKPRLRRGPLNHTFSLPASSVSQHRTLSSSVVKFIQLIYLIC